MKAIVAVLAVVLVVPAAVAAHHSFAAVFDVNSPVEIEGEITKVEWANPHIWFYLDVVNADGEVEHWQCEGGTPNSLRRQGWRSDTLEQGDHVEIEGWRAHDGTNTCNARTITEDGQRLFAGTSYQEQ
jgi:Family of unknown function (DUF6152)